MEQFSQKQCAEAAVLAWVKKCHQQIRVVQLLAEDTHRFKQFESLQQALQTCKVGVLRQRFQGFYGAWHKGK